MNIKIRSTNVPSQELQGVKGNNTNYPDGNEGRNLLIFFAHHLINSFSTDIHFTFLQTNITIIFTKC